MPICANCAESFGLSICTFEWTNHKWNAEYYENSSRLRVFLPRTGTRPVGTGLSQAAWVKLNRLGTGVGQFHSSIHKWGFALSPKCKCGTTEQTADQVLMACPIHWGPHGAQGLTVLDNKTQSGLTTSLPASDPGSAAAWGSKKDKSSAPVLFMPDQEWIPFQATMTALFL